MPKRTQERDEPVDAFVGIDADAVDITSRLWILKKRASLENVLSSSADSLGSELLKQHFVGRPNLHRVLENRKSEKLKKLEKVLGRELCRVFQNLVCGGVPWDAIKTTQSVSLADHQHTQIRRKADDTFHPRQY